MPIIVLGDTVPAWLMAIQASVDQHAPVDLVAPGLAPETRTFEVTTLDGPASATVVTGPSLPEVRPTTKAVAVVTDVLARSRDLIDHYAPDLLERRLLLAPSGAGGAVAAREVFRSRGLTAPDLAETIGMPVLGTLQDREARINTRKHGLPIGVLDPSLAEAFLADFGPYLPGAVAVDGVLATSLANTNNIVHPPLTIVNAALVDAGVPFRFYREGTTSAGARLVEAVDADRLAVTDALGLERVPLTTWFARFYGHMGMREGEIGEMLRSFAPFTDSPGPAALGHRYLVDDVASGLAVIEAVGAASGVATPTISALCTTASVLVDTDLRSGARSLADLLLESRTPAGVGT